MRGEILMPNLSESSSAKSLILDRYGQNVWGIGSFSDASGLSHGEVALSLTRCCSDASTVLDTLGAQGFSLVAVTPLSTSICTGQSTAVSYTLQGPPGALLRKPAAQIEGKRPPEPQAGVSE